MSLTTHLPQDLEALADSLSASADELHARLMRALRGQQPLAGALTQEAAQALFDNEVALRQQANSLYVDAATISLRGMGAPRQELLDLAAQARLAIRRINVRKDLAGLTADLLEVAGAVVAMRPERLAKPLENLKSHLAALHKDRSA
jgi:hypothetical protein